MNYLSTFGIIFDFSTTIESLIFKHVMTGSIKSIEYAIENEELFNENFNEYEFMQTRIKITNYKYYKYDRNRWTNVLTLACAYNDPDVALWMMKRFYIVPDALTFLMAIKNNAYKLLHIKAILEKMIEAEYQVVPLHSESLPLLTQYIARRDDDVLSYVLDKTEYILYFFPMARMKRICVPPWLSQNRLGMFDRLKRLNHSVLIMYNNLDKAVNPFALAFTLSCEYIVTQKRYDLLNIKDGILNYGRALHHLKYEQVTQLCTICSNIKHILHFEVSDFPQNVRIFHTPYTKDLTQKLCLFEKDEYNEHTFSCVFVNDNTSNIDPVKYYTDVILFRAIRFFDKCRGFGGSEITNGITLKIDQSKKIFDVYITACITGNLNFNNLGINELVELIQLMDMYPNIMFSIEDIDKYIARILVKDVTNDLDESKRDFFFVMCNRYMLRRTYFVLNEITWTKRTVDIVDDSVQTWIYDVHDIHDVFFLHDEHDA
jgi:hypothetical protein